MATTEYCRLIYALAPSRTRLAMSIISSLPSSAFIIERKNRQANTNAATEPAKASNQ